MDIAEFLRRECAADAVRECVCRPCGGRSFEVSVLDAESAARRTCLSCGEHEFIADSAEHWDAEAEAEQYCACLCGDESFAAAVGYSLRESGDVKWIHLALGCLTCGSIGLYEDWKIDYLPSVHLLDQA
ncbi:hypothetical protein [Herbidospora daliensis]|uniref:hypothetical protein n=1 Tax=Herbidospora daliensis TaxID=295585 RepID=UPI000783AFEF|nr:hypothetical protein [Herbidospora daliensis]